MNLAKLPTMKFLLLFLVAFPVALSAEESPSVLESLEKSLGLKAPVPGGFVVRGKVERTGIRMVDGQERKYSLKVFKDSQATLPIFFASGSVKHEATKEKANRSAVQALAQVMADYPAAKFVLEGHTCDLGSKERNSALSWQRAEAIKSRLIALGVEPQRLLVLGFGESEGPVNFGGEAASDENEEARKNFRRVVVRQWAP